MWADSHTPGGLARNEIMAEVVMAEILTLIEKDPIGAAKSWIGDLMLEKYAWMMTTEDVRMKWGERHAAFAEKNNSYPYRFELVDILGQNVSEIVAQLIADEYYMGGPDSTPFTPEALLMLSTPVVGMENGQIVKRSVPRDIFASEWRPDVTVEFDGKTHNEGGAIVPKPKEGFREI